MEKVVERRLKGREAAGMCLLNGRLGRDVVERRFAHGDNSGAVAGPMLLSSHEIEVTAVDFIADSTHRSVRS